MQMKILLYLNLGAAHKSKESSGGAQAARFKDFRGKYNFEQESRAR